ncbi:MAG TPA: site-specific integrase [Candidatus Aminicenantes bacterium]|nr:site-specific integrase [Candidatus Aminicenantes bacterium]HRY66239.1 site-specific integrase [Candidatus Aminicenantes bacterium]HRZ73153.1 site-specific integrase [Candidatus Aminicenantes bacterium]
MNVKKTSGGRWAYDFWFSGKRYIRVVGESKEQAESAMAVHRKRLLDEKFGLASPITDLRFDDFSEDYFKKVSKQKRSWRRDRLSLDHLEHAFRGKMTSEITKQAIEEYKIKRIKKVAAATVNREIALLSNVFTTAIDWKNAVSNPVTGVARYEEPDPVERPLTSDEEERLLAAASKRLRPILILLINTGMRRNELLSLRWKNINFVASQVVIPKTNCKRKHMRMVPLNSLAIETLRAIPRIHDYVFHNKRTGTYIRDIKTSFHKACETAGIKRLRLHDLRHTFATRLRDKGESLTTIMKLMGHSKYETTLRYAHVLEKSQHEAVEKLVEQHQSNIFQKGRRKGRPYRRLPIRPHNSFIRQRTFNRAPAG